ncbi:hypothetical protein SERLA73DRAFT_82352 [Serpula lacrymans var. lacrymans S7.3]|uniref:F-box domain-containing protein n=2 Tax=Serpula lacrymans var. lacrymans TaxID=341189 RepID=F8PG95_SERL3|nr:hypothetical protein SERLA73DRAFT_82352 [Serpula lacrymans var. lacrymans S7.3]
MFLAILRDPEATKKLLESILDSSNGRRSLSRLARTCRAICDPALSILWRELDSILPLISLFPNHLMKRSRRPGLGLAKAPTVYDWTKLLAYGERVLRITYTENPSNMASSVFTTFSENRPQTYILPHLQQLVWKVETQAGLDRCLLFLNPELQSLVLEVGTKLPQLSSFLVDVCSRTQLTSFSFSSPTNLPDNFTDLLRSQCSLMKLVLVAPGALSSQVGQWSASLPCLTTLELDLTGRSIIAVEGFFDDIVHSGASTPSDASSDSGVFSGDEIDFTEIRKSSLRLTGDLQTINAFSQLRELHLTGEVANIAVFLRHLTSTLTRLDIVIEDPPDKTDWMDLSSMICERFGKTLLGLHVTATGSSRFNELVRSTSRGGDGPSRRLPLGNINLLTYLLRLEIDLPESVVFYDEDLARVAEACPNVEILRLCPVSRFSGPIRPSLSLEGIAALTRSCRRLHTLALVLDARPGSKEILRSHGVSSRSLLRLHVGHSNVHDPLQTTILLSHLAPYLETLKWFHEKNRPGFIEVNAQGWQRVSDWLPHLQDVRLGERQKASEYISAPRQKSERSVDATTTRIRVDKGLQAKLRTTEMATQVSPLLMNRLVEAKPHLFSVLVDATPSLVDASIEAMPCLTHESVGAHPNTVSREVDGSLSTETKAVGTMVLLDYQELQNTHARPFYVFPATHVPIIAGLFSFAWRVFISYPLSIPMHMIDMSLSMLHTQRKKYMNEAEPDNHASASHSIPSSDLLDHDTPPVCL